MVYSLSPVQPRAQQFFGRADRYEAFATVLAAGARPKVLGLCAVLAGSGVALTAAEVAGSGVPVPWTMLILAKSVLLAAAFGLFAHVSWRLWPARVLTSPAELPVLQRRFRSVATVLTAVVAAGAALGSVADAVR